MASYSAEDICNFAGGKLGGFGDQVSGAGEIISLSDTDAVSVACNREWPRAREQVIKDVAIKKKSPIRETIKMAELDDELTDRDVVISDIVSASQVVTVTTKTVHEKTTGDTIVLKGIDADSGVGLADVGILNGSTYTITVLTTATFSLDSTTGNDAFDYTEDSGIVSEAPEMGPYTYAFDMPSDALAAYRITDESFVGDDLTRKHYRFTTILNRDGDGLLILTNELTNADGDGIYLEYVIDQATPTLFSMEAVDAIATLLASNLAPTVGRNIDVRFALYNEYEKFCLMDLASYNNSQRNARATSGKDFRGGRSAVLPQGI